MMLTTSHSQSIHFTSRLCDAIRKLYYHNYFSYLDQAYHLIHWDLINKDKRITTKGIQFAKGRIGIEKTIHVSPRFNNDPDPEILRGDTFIFMEDPGAKV